MSLSKVTGQPASPIESGASAVRGWRGAMQTAVVLFKLRIVFLLLMAATGGAFLAAGGWPGWGVILLTWATGGLAAAGASALNQYWERNRDGLMGRTRKRPLVNGAITDPRWVPWVGALLIAFPIVAVLPFNRPLAFFLALGAFIYVGIYTIWLKPRTLLNIVIGGAAGSAAVLSGAAAAGVWNAPGALALAAILFLWTPFHFWSLAILYRDEYRRADVPMLPVQTTPHRAAWWVMSHTAPTGLLGLLLVVLPGLGWIFFLPVLAVTLDLFYRNVMLIADPSPLNARRLFMSSNTYLLALLLAICVDLALPW
jgi:protoheme IX farnesyltransferase